MKITQKKFASIINSPVILLVISLGFGTYFIPKILTQSQIQYQDNQKKIDTKYSFSVNFLKQCWQSLYFARNYYGNFKEEPDFLVRKDKLWDDYHEASVEWNVNIVTNSFALRKYYGEDVKQYFEKEVLPNVANLHLELLHIRDNESVNQEKIEEYFKVLDNRMYILAEKINNYP